MLVVSSGLLTAAYAILQYHLKMTLLGIDRFDQPCNPETDPKSHLTCESSQAGSKCCSLRPRPCACWNLIAKGIVLKMHALQCVTGPSGLCLHLYFEAIVMNEFLSRGRSFLLSWSYSYLPFSTEWLSETMPIPWLWTPLWFSRTASRTMGKYISISHKISSFGYSYYTSMNQTSHI